MTKACAPDPFEGMDRKDRNKMEHGFDQVVEKVVTNILVRKSARHLLREVYMAGLYHGTLASNGWEQK